MLKTLHACKGRSLYALKPGKQKNINAAKL